jgi:glyoxylase-like metal-dependent hydrolase (beta-lactamase superfamily II)
MRQQRPKTKDAFVIDPVLDFDLASGKISQKSVKGLAEFIKQQGYNVVRIIETHVHADHLTGAHVLKKVSDHSSTCLSQLTLIQLD